jgi:hypothetical protein
METWPDELGLAAWRQAYRSLQDAGSPSCPPEDRLIALVLHEPPCAERAELADHMVRCRRCTDLYQLLLCVRHDRRAARPAQLLPKPPQQATDSQDHQP